MPLRPSVLCVMAAALLAACASQPAPSKTDSIDFARGCWISRTPADGPNPLTRTIRLLPSRTGAAKLEGELLIYNVQPDLLPVSVPLSIDLDGRHALRGADIFTAVPSPASLGPLQKGWMRLSFSTAPTTSGKGETRWLFVEGDGEHLRLSSSAGVDFEGARDGCD